MSPEQLAINDIALSPNVIEITHNYQHQRYRKLAEALAVDNIYLIPSQSDTIKVANNEYQLYVIENLLTDYYNYMRGYVELNVMVRRIVEAVTAMRSPNA